MKEFTEACAGNTMVMTWELENILVFSSIPDEKEFTHNVLVDVINKCEYSFDIFSTGSIKDSSNSDITLSMISGKATSTDRTINTYGYNLMTNKINGKPSEIKKCANNVNVGMKNVFNSICSFKYAYNIPDIPKYTGIIINKVAVYCIDKRLFSCVINKLDKVNEIANNVELYSYDSSSVYFIKKDKVDSKVTKNNLYKYDVRDKKVRICAITYTY